MTIKYAKIINQKTKQCEVGLGTNAKFYQSIGMIEQEVEQAYDGSWYLLGYAPLEPEKTYIERRVAEYPLITEQLDMIYHDFENWKAKIAEIKAKYPKE